MISGNLGVTVNNIFSYIMLTHESLWKLLVTYIIRPPKSVDPMKVFFCILTVSIFGPMWSMEPFLVSGIHDVRSLVTIPTSKQGNCHKHGHGKVNNQTSIQDFDMKRYPCNFQYLTAFLHSFILQTTFTILKVNLFWF